MRTSDLSEEKKEITNGKVVEGEACSNCRCIIEDYNDDAFTRNTLCKGCMDTKRPAYNTKYTED